MSPDKDQEYFADGIAEELLNRLAQVPDLKVIARTSSFAFKGEKIDIAEIAKKLNVAHVLEGSMRKSGNKLRITAQLVRTADSTHLWSETMTARWTTSSWCRRDRQGDRAGAANTARRWRVESSERRHTEPRGISAVPAVLQCPDQTTRSSLDAAGEYAEQAIKLDPNYG